jgi:hypothetical protein
MRAGRAMESASLQTAHHDQADDGAGTRGSGNILVDQELAANQAGHRSDALTVEQMKRNHEQHISPTLAASLTEDCAEIKSCYTSTPSKQSMIPKMPVPDAIGDGNDLSKMIERNQTPGAAIRFDRIASRSI